jgi:AGCS family alanine or glycine:cation symporter
MTIPNLLGILTLSKEMKNEVTLFFDEYLQKFPGKKGDQLKLK